MAGRGLIPGRIGIELRSAKERVGDFGADTIVGVKHRGAIVSLVERKTKVTRLVLIPKAGAEETHNAMIATLTEFNCGAYFKISVKKSMISFIFSCS